MTVVGFGAGLLPLLCVQVGQRVVAMVIEVPRQHSGKISLKSQTQYHAGGSFYLKSNQINFIYTPQFSKTIQGCLQCTFFIFISKQQKLLRNSIVSVDVITALK